MSEAESQIELVTVSSQDFLPGTQVMLDSFHRHNPWFDGAITVLHDDLEPREISALQRDFGKLRCQRPTSELAQAIAMLVEARPGLASRMRRFYSLDTFAEGAGATAIFVDSDILFRAGVEPALQTGGAIAACGDRALLIGNARDAETLEEQVGRTGSEGFRSFNAGFLVVQPRLRNSAMHARLLDELAPERWDALKSDHTDQAVLNRVFGRDVAILAPGYNWMVGHASRLPEGATGAIGDSKVLHFNGKAKPWKLSGEVQDRSQEPAYAFALREWHQSYRRFLQRRCKP